jgi:WD40 repeat protein
VNPNIPEGCSVIVGHAMAKEPVSRYPSAIAMANALSRLLVEEGVESSISVGDTPRGASLLGDGTDPIVPSIRHGLVGPAGGDGPRDYAEGDGVGRAVFLAGTAAAILLIVLLARHLLLSEPQQPAPSETLAPWPAEIAADGEVGLLAFAGDNRLVWTTGGKNGKVSSCRLGETVEESWSVALPEAVALAVAPDGATFAVASATEARVLLLHASTGQEKRVLTPLPNGTIRGLAFHPSGNLMAIGVTDTASDKGHQVMVLNLTTEASPILLRGLPAAIRCLQFAPPGGMLAAGLADGTIILWTTGAWEESRRVKMSDQPVVDLSFSPDGFQLVETASDRQREAFARIWDTRTGEPRQTYGPLPAAARGACVSMDGKLLIIGHPGGPLFVELATDKRLSTPPETDPPIHALALSRDGRRMWGAAGRTIRPWLLPRTE